MNRYDAIMHGTDKPGYHQHEAVNSPNHYVLDSKEPITEVIHVIKATLGEEGFKAYCHGNMIKYLLRANKKNHIEDYKKAAKYLEYYLANDN